MANKENRNKYFTPPRLSVFQTEVAGPDESVQQRPRSKRYFPSPNLSPGTVFHSKVSGEDECSVMLAADSSQLHNKSVLNDNNACSELQPLHDVSQLGVSALRRSTRIKETVAEGSTCTTLPRESSRTDAQHKLWIPPSKQGTRSIKYFVSPEPRVDEVQTMLSGEDEPSVMLAADSSQLHNKSVLNDNNACSELQPLHDVSQLGVSALRRSTRIKGKAESSLISVSATSTFELPSRISEFMKMGVTDNSVYSPSDCAKYTGAAVGNEGSATSNAESNSPAVSAVEGVQSTQLRAKTRQCTPQLRSSRTSPKETSKASLLEADDSPGCRSAAVSVPSTSSSRALKQSVNSVHPVTIGRDENGAACCTPATVPTYLPQPATLSSRIPVAFNLRNHGLGSSKKNTATKQLADKGPFQFTAKSTTAYIKPTVHATATLSSRIPVAFNLRNHGLGSSKKNTATKQLADKGPFQFTAKSTTAYIKPTVHATGFASRRAEATTQRRITARCIALKQAPGCKDARTLRHQKYNEIVRTNRSHELMMRRKI